MHTLTHTHALSGQSDVGSWVNFGYCGIKQTPCLGLGATVEIKERERERDIYINAYNVAPDEK